MDCYVLWIFSWLFGEIVLILFYGLVCWLVGCLWNVVCGVGCVVFGGYLR